MTTQFVRAPHVRSVVHGDRTVLLDLLRERYYSFDEVGTRVWVLLGEGADIPTIVAQLSREFDAPVEQIGADVQGFLQQLAGEWKVIVPAVSAVEPSGLVCALTLVVTTLALRVAGLRRSLAMAERLSRRAHRAADPSPELLSNVARKVAMAAAFFPGRALCLEQSLALSICLRRSGIPAELRIGAQPYPFTAHAWVECRGALVGTSHDQVCQFVPFDLLTEAV